VISPEPSSRGAGPPGVADSGASGPFEVQAANNSPDAAAMIRPTRPTTRALTVSASCTRLCPRLEDRGTW
jgi:hypothetical protein